MGCSSGGSVGGAAEIIGLFLLSGVYAENTFAELGRFARLVVWSKQDLDVSWLYFAGHSNPMGRFRGMRVLDCVAG